MAQISQDTIPAGSSKGVTTGYSSYLSPSEKELMTHVWVAIDLLERLLQFDPAKRITAAEALQHSYFTSAGLGPNSGGAVPTPYPSAQHTAVIPQPPPPGQYNYPHPPQSGVVYSNPQIAQIPQPQQPQPQQNGFGQYPAGYAHASR